MFKMFSKRTLSSLQHPCLFNYQIVHKWWWYWFAIFCTLIKSDDGIFMFAAPPQTLLNQGWNGHCIDWRPVVSVAAASAASILVVISNELLCSIVLILSSLKELSQSCGSCWTEKCFRYINVSIYLPLHDRTRKQSFNGYINFWCGE